jgi:hypothetical protein
MADISKLSRLIGGLERQVDLSTNSLVVGSLKVGSVSPTELTKAILDNLINLQNGTDFANGTNSHTHDGRYFTETELSSSTSSSGSDLIGDDNTYSNFTPAAATVKGALSGIDSALAAAAGTSFSDAVFEIYDNVDPTKLLHFQLSAISGSATRTITMADADVNLGLVLTAIQRDGSVAFTANQSLAGFKLTNLAAATVAGDAVRYQQAILTSGVNAFAADQSFGGFKATNLADPVSSQDAVTLAYFNARLNGLTPKAPVKAATLVAGTLATSFEDGDVIDGIALATGDRILIKNQAAPAQNGIYVVQATGAPVRSTDMDSLTPFDEINGAWVPVQLGTQAGQVFVQYGNVATIGTDPINFSYFNPIAGLIGGDMITFAGSTFSVDLATTSGLESTNPGNVAGQLRIKLEASNPSLQITGSNELAAKLNAAGAITSGASGLTVAVDNSTIEISANALRVKDLGITLAKLAANSVDENKIVSSAFSATGAITGGSGTKIAVAVDNTSVEINTNALRVKSTAYDQSTIVGGSGSAASVASAPALATNEIAGEVLSITTLVALRYAKAADAGFVAGRMYKSDFDATTADNLYVIGLAFPASGVSAGGAVRIVEAGEINVPAHGFTIGLPLYLGANGAVTATAPSTSNQAVVKLGMVKDANTIRVQIQIIGIN